MITPLGTAGPVSVLLHAPGNGSSAFLTIHVSDPDAMLSPRMVRMVAGLLNAAAAECERVDDASRR